METKQCEQQPINPNPTFDVFGHTVTLPPQTTPIVLLLIILTNVVLILKSKPAEFAVDLLRGSDLALLENLDDIAVELRELTKADRVLIAGFHNGKQNQVYHWKRISVLAEATRLGIEPVSNKLKDIDTFSLMALSDYEYLTKLKADKTFIHTHLDLPTISSKQKRFLSNCYMFGQYIMLLVDDVAVHPHGIIFVQYDSREKYKVQSESEVGWSDSTRKLAHDKARLINSLIYDLGTSNKTKMLDWVKKKLRIS
ncbi:hypothetical protein [Pseudanabaena phage PA-SR01]|nr:hypothetical protein [Pseudanabaena phage PA-SR01]